MRDGLKSAEDVKVGDVLCLLMTQGYRRESAWFAVPVTHVTKTRFKVRSPYNETVEYEFYKKNARQYGEDSGYGRTYLELYPMDDVAKERIEVSKLDRRFEKYLHNLDRAEARDGYSKLDNFDKRKVVAALEAALIVLLPKEKEG